MSETAIAGNPVKPPTNYELEAVSKKPDDQLVGLQISDYASFGICSDIGAIMNVAVIAGNPVKPPTNYELEAVFNKLDAQLVDLQTSGYAPIVNYTDLWAQVSSASRLSTTYTVLLTRQESHIDTTSWVNVFDLYIDLLQAETRANSVNVENATENLFEIRRLTGFTWNNLARLLNVDRRTLNNWAKGTKIREKNRNHIAETLGVLRFIDRGAAELNSSALNEHHVLHEPNPFEAIRTGNYEAAKQRLSPGVSRQYESRSATHATPLYGEFQPMVMHADADGTEMIESLPDESAPVSRKRQIKRG